MRVSDHHFTMPEAPVFGTEDPFFDSEGMTALESERCLSGGGSFGARVGHAAAPHSSDGSDTYVKETN